jgi:sugar phosphate isomerase/epimerase
MPVVKLSRRDLLSAATAIAAASSLPGAARAADHGLNLGIQLYSLRGYPVDEALRHAREIGFRYVEFWPGIYPLSSSSEQIAAMNKKLADLGLTISAHGVNGFGADAAANRKVFEFAKAAGIRTLGADPAPEAFASLDDLVKEFDIRIAIHNHGPKHRYNKVLDVLRAIEKHDERIGACADLGHFIRSGENPVEVIRLLKGRLYGIHLKDFQDQQENTKGVILGKGHLDVPAVFAALEQVNFPADGALSLEYEENPKDPLADIRACFEVATSALAAA